MPLAVDALIVGGGATGLWLRTLLKQYARSVVLIEAGALGGGQTIGSQGIIHSGARYVARTGKLGVLHALPVMTAAWERHLAGENIPDLRGTEVMTSQCWYWNPEAPLPECLQNWWRQSHPGGADAEHATPPEVLQSCRQVRCECRERSLSPASLLNVLAGDDRSDLLQVPAENIRWQVSGPGEVTSVTLRHPSGGNELVVRPQHVFLTAGAGNAALRDAVGLPGEAVMQRRPLRMALLRGPLPRLCGHLFDDDGPRLTISTQFDQAGRTIWQLGGRLAETPDEGSSIMFLKTAREELLAALPGLELARVEWSSYNAVRAEPQTGEGGLPDDVGILSAGNVITLWPTKLTLLPYLMIDLRRVFDAGGKRPAAAPLEIPDWPCPPVAQPPWESAANWIPDIRIANA